MAAAREDHVCSDTIVERKWENQVPVLSSRFSVPMLRQDDSGEFSLIRIERVTGGTHRAVLARKNARPTRA
jgi:hypothetical protein